MNRYTLRMLARSVRESLGRYLAILAIVALGVGFFAGLKSACPAMLTTADDYLREQRLYDFQLLSTLGFTDEDVSAFASLDGVAAAEGAYFADAFAEAGGTQDVYHLMSLPEQLNLPVLTEGRMPETASECLADSRVFSARDIGSVVVITEENDEDTLELLNETAFTIVGLAKSPRYISDARGDTSLGSGSIRGFLLLPKAAFSSEAYHELCLWCDIPAAIYSDEYEAARDRLEERVKTLLGRRGRLRYTQLRREADEELADAQKEIDAGWADYYESRTEVEQELADALREGERSPYKLDAAQLEVDGNRAALEAAMTKLPAARQEIADGRAALAAQEAELDAAQEQLTAAARELDTQEAALADGRAQLESTKAETLTPYQEQLAAVSAAVAALEGQLAALREEETETAAALQAELSAQQSAQAQLQGAVAAIEESFAEQEAALAAGAQAVAAGRGELKAREAELAAGRAAIAEGYARLNAAEAEIQAAEAAYPDNLAQLDAAQAQIDYGWGQWFEGRQEYEDGAAEAEQEFREAEEKLRDAERELADAAEDADTALRLETYTLTRGSNRGYLTFDNDIRIIDGLANVFPIFFSLVAALVCVTTMTRMINEERTVIGTMKAMGYSAGAIMSKYLLYSGSSSLIGCIAGFLLGSTAIPYIVWIAYGIIYDYARLEFYFSAEIVAGALAVSVMGTAFVTWLACRRELRERPAELIRPKAPRRGRRILLERIRPLWRRLPFLSKVSLRSAFRYPVRVLMILLGVGGCTALLVAGFGAKDSVARIADYQYGEIFLYDLAVSLDVEDFPDDAAAAALWENDVARWAMTWQEPVTLRAGSEEKSTRVIGAPPGELEGLISLHDDAGELPFPGPGEAVITEKLAETLSLAAGDELELELDDGGTLALRVSGVCKNYLNHYVFVDTASVGEPRRNVALLAVAEGVDTERLGARLRAEDGVTYVTLTAQERETMEQSMASLDLLVLMLIVCSGALAFITLYNLTNINIMERTREIATVKVLGFYPPETAAYILRENLLLSFLGALFGLLLGKLLHYVVIRAIVVDSMSYEIRIAPLSYALAFAITFLFAALTNAAMRRRLEAVNMAESLKSVE